MHISKVRIACASPLAGLLCIALALGAAGCRNEPTAQPEVRENAGSVAASPADYLIGLLDEIHAIAAWGGPRSVSAGRDLLPLGKASAESVYVYGEITPEGYGAVVTERHAYPKGMLLITVRKSYGMPGGHVASEVTRYTSVGALQRHESEQASLTEVFGQGDTIVTRVLANGVQETYTFRLPVLTTTVGSTPELTRTGIRFAQGGEVVVETRDGFGQLVQAQRSRGEADGTLVTVTSYPDGSWRESRSVGRGDGSVYRETRTGP